MRMNFVEEIALLERVVNVGKDFVVEMMSIGFRRLLLHLLLPSIFPHPPPPATCIPSCATPILLLLRVYLRFPLRWHLPILPDLLS
ncbi:hypothetical protein L1887_23350 [Cichorium endivia]|nr:hypothetical protein L1887_23350 [Cichorium endivia]